MNRIESPTRLTPIENKKEKKDSTIHRSNPTFVDFVRHLFDVVAFDDRR